MDDVVDSVGDASIVTFQADFRDPSAVHSLWEQSVNWRDGIDVLINNAAIIRFVGGIDDPEDVWNETWDDTLAVNVMAPCNLMRHAVPHYRDNGGGIIISISSWVAHRGPGNPAMMAYSASKAAVMNATRRLLATMLKTTFLLTASRLVWFEQGCQSSSPRQPEVRRK